MNLHYYFFIIILRIMIPYLCQIVWWTYELTAPLPDIYVYLLLYDEYTYYLILCTFIPLYEFADVIALYYKIIYLSNRHCLRVYLLRFGLVLINILPYFWPKKILFKHFFE